MITTIIAIFGLIIGSFLTVCIYRIPLGREDIQAELAQNREQANEPEPREISNIPPNFGINNPKRSICLNCHNQLRWFHNIPLFSWLYLGGKCSFCKQPISARYPAVEGLTALTAVLSYTIYDLTPTGLLVFAFSAALIVISFIDYDYYIIPNIISLPGVIVGLVIAGINQFFHIFSLPVVPGLLQSILGILAGGGFLFMVSEVYLRLRKREGLGMGDVKLLAMTGAFFGVEGSLYTIFIGSLFGSILGIILILVSGKKMTHQLPFGPYLAFGTLLYLFTGNTLAVFFVSSIQKLLI